MPTLGRNTARLTRYEAERTTSWVVEKRSEIVRPQARKEAKNPQLTKGADSQTSATWAAPVTDSA